jgi:hypothetical protein
LHRYQRPEHCHQREAFECALSAVVAGLPARRVCPRVRLTFSSLTTLVSVHIQRAFSGNGAGRSYEDRGSRFSLVRGCSAVQRSREADGEIQAGASLQLSHMAANRRRSSARVAAGRLAASGLFGRNGALGLPQFLGPHGRLLRLSPILVQLDDPFAGLLQRGSAGGRDRRYPLQHPRVTRK